jgi:hypothetical protein
VEILGNQKQAVMSASMRNIFIGKAHSPIVDIREQLHFGLAKVDDRFELCCHYVIQNHLVRDDLNQ